MSKFLVNVFMLKTRALVNLYTLTTLPFYYVRHKPWKVLELSKQIKSKKLQTINGELVWTRNDSPTVHPHLSSRTYVEVFNSLEDMYGPNRLMLGQREILESQTQLDVNGNPIKTDGKVLRKFKLSDYKWLTLREVNTRVDNIAKGLINFGVKSGDKVIIFAETRVEWFLCSIAIMKLNATLVTLFANLGDSGIIYGINQTGAQTIITTYDLLPKLKSFIHKTPSLTSILYIKNKSDSSAEIVKFSKDVNLKSLEELEEIGANDHSTKSFALPKPEDLAVIMYTSGTTGNPKAVLITQKQLFASLRVLLSNVKSLEHEAERHVYISYLPLAHIMGFTLELFLFSGGVRIGYGTPLTLTESSPGLLPGQISDMKLLRPTAMTTVPLVLDRIIKEIYDKLNSRSPISAPLFTYLMNYKIFWTKRGYQTPIINALICKKVKEQLGGVIEHINVGGAPLNKRTQALIKAALDVRLIQGYGATETCGGIIGMHLDDLSDGIIGVPLDGVKVKLINWDEGGYCISDSPNPRGELVIGSDIVANGYYQLQQQTDESFIDDNDGTRWFATGDIAEVFPNGSFKIIDRKKDLTKLANGEFISLGKIETSLKSCEYVDNVCICTNEFANNVIALITPTNKHLFKLAAQLNKKDYTREQLCNDSEVIDTIYKSILVCAKYNNLNKKEIPVKIKLCAEEWTADNNLLTAAFKLKRNNIMMFYKNDINNMFDFSIAEANIVT